MSDLRIRLTPRYLRDIVWDQWIASVEDELGDARNMLASMSKACEATRGRMSYNTGSISFASSVLLYIATRNIRPRRIFEVGTFIGKSTLSMALAVDVNGNDAEIFTCDGSNDFDLPSIAKCKITGFPKTLSSDALQQVMQAGLQFDFLHLDGRIGQRDVELIGRVADPNVVIALDDFEGTEKGVANLSILRSQPFFAKHTLIYPAADHALQRLNLCSSTTTAFFVPVSALTVSYQ